MSKHSEERQKHVKDERLWERCRKERKKKEEKVEETKEEEEKEGEPKQVMEEKRVQQVALVEEVQGVQQKLFWKKR